MDRTASRAMSVKSPADAAGTSLLQTLRGESGAEITLVEREGQSLVRKVAREPSANNRLLAQIDKQKRHVARGIRLPNVWSSGIDPDGRAFMEMEYVPSCSVAALIVSGMHYDRPQLMDALERLLCGFRADAGGTLRAEAVASKISEVSKTVRLLFPSGPEAQTLEWITRMLLAADWSGIPESDCHGDLTLENILLSPQDGVVFVDCDVPWVSSFWFDIAKILQDTLGHWCLRDLQVRDPRDPSLVVARERLAAMMPDVWGLVGRLAPDGAARMRQMSGLQLFRTLSYLRSAALRSYVLARIVEILAPSSGRHLR